MTKDEIMNDTDFKQRCKKYGLHLEDCIVYYEVILLNTPIKDLYIIFDKNYNTIAIEKFKLDCSMKNKIDFIRRKYYEYCSFTDKVPHGENFGYPFESFTLKQIIDLSCKIEIMETNHGHSLSTMIDGVWCDRQSEEDENYFQLLSYIKFLGEEIQNYFLINYHLQAIGLEVPNVYEYVRTLINQVNNSIDFHLEHNRRPWPSDILNSLGQSHRELNLDGALYDVINLMMNDKGFKIKSGSTDEIEEFDKPNSESNLSVLARQLLKIQNLSNEGIEDYISKKEGPLLYKNKKMILNTIIKI